jgi:hypothetical protein
MSLRIVMLSARAARGVGVRFRSRDGRNSAGFTKPKKNCAERLRGRVRGPLATQNARIEPTDSRRRRRSRPCAASRESAAKEIFGIDLANAETPQPSFSRAARRRTSRSDADALLEQIVDRLRIGLATRSLHHLADKPADRLRIGLGVADLVGILGDDVVDELFERRNVGHLL